MMDDLISREATLDAFADYVAHGMSMNDYDALEDIVIHMPSVSTEKTGRWEWVQYDGNPNIGNWHCSECNRIVCGAITAANPVYAYKYCPNCGCRMMEVEE